MNEQAQERHSPARWPSVVFGIFVGLLLLARLLRLSGEGLSASFDSAIYIRNLWGISQGDWVNPLVNNHVFCVHGNWVLLLLAPLVRFCDPELLLTLAQGLALGATAGLLHFGFLEALGERASRGRRLVVATLLSAGLLAGPVAMNPFLFDLRPDMLGLPLLLAGLLRARRSGWDRSALLWMAAALLVREEFAMVIIGAMATAPFGRSLLVDWRRRGAVIFAVLAFVAIYWFGVRGWLFPQSVERASGVASQMLDNASPLPLSQVLAYKTEILCAVFFGGGLLPLFGWRWLGVAMPGLALLLMQSRMQADLLNFHYAIFALPGLAIASVDGLARVVSGPRHAPLLVVSAATMVALFATSSALPGGGRHFVSREAATNSDGSLRLTVDGVPLYEAMNTMVAALPPDDGVAVPFALSAGAAARSTIVTTEQVKQWVSKGETFPANLHWVVLFGKDFEGLGSRLVSEHGLHLVTTVEQSLAVLTDRDAPTNWEAFAGPAKGCAPWAEWPGAGLRLCAPDQASAGWWVERTAGIALPVPTDLFLEPTTGPPVLFRGVSGLVDLSSLPVGWSLAVRGAEGSGVSFASAVVAASGRAISCRALDGSIGPRCNINFAPPTPPVQGRRP